MTPRQIPKSELTIFWDKKSTKNMVNLLVNKARFSKLIKQLSYLETLVNFKLSSSQLEALKKPMGLVRGYMTTFNALMDYVESQHVIISMASISDIKKSMRQSRSSMRRIHDKISLQTENNAGISIKIDNFKKQLEMILNNHKKLKSILKKDLSILQEKDLLATPVKLIENQFFDLEVKYFSEIESEFAKQTKKIDLLKITSYFKSWAGIKSANLVRLAFAFKLIDEIKSMYFFLRVSEQWKISSASHSSFIKYLKSIGCHDADVTVENRKINQLVNIVKLQWDLQAIESCHMERIESQPGMVSPLSKRGESTSVALASLGYVDSDDLKKAHQRGRSSSFDDSSLARLSVNTQKTLIKTAPVLSQQNSFPVNEKSHQRMRSRSFFSAVEPSQAGKPSSASSVLWAPCQPDCDMTSPRSSLLILTKQTSESSEVEKKVKTPSF